MKSVVLGKPLNYSTAVVQIQEQSIAVFHYTLTGYSLEPLILTNRRSVYLARVSVRTLNFVISRRTGTVKNTAISIFDKSPIKSMLSKMP